MCVYMYYTYIILLHGQQKIKDNSLYRSDAD